MTTTAVPETSAEWDHYLSGLGSPAEFAKAFQSGDFQNKLKGYIEAQNKERDDITAQVRDETQRVMAEILKTKKHNVPANFNPLDRKRVNGGGKGVFYNKKAPGAAVDDAGLFKDDYSTLFQAISPQAKEGSLRLPQQVHDDFRKLVEIQNSFGTTVPADGGFLVPESLRSDLMQVSLEMSLIRPRATVIPMSTARVGVPYVDSTTNSGSVLGGFVFYWTEEGAALTESQGKFGQVVLDANKLTGFCAAPNELVADSAGAFGAYLDQTLPKGLAFTEDYAFINGNGVGKPLGFVNNNAAVIQSAESGQGASTIVWENIVKMYSRMLPGSLSNAVWIASIDTFPQLATMALSVGTGGSAVWINNGAEGPAVTILGRPVIFTEKTPALGTTGDINFVDLSYYLIGDRQTMQVESSRDYLFGNDKTAYRIIERVDGRPWIQSAVTPANGSSNTLSPFVQLSSTRT